MTASEEDQFRLDMTPAAKHTAAENVQDVIRLIRLRSALSDPPPQRVRSRHEAYGIAAENYTNVANALKLVKKDAETLLGTLGDIDRPALKAVRCLCDTSFEAAVAALVMAAEMQRTLHDLNAVENMDTHYPMDDLSPADVSGTEENE